MLDKEQVKGKLGDFLSTYYGIKDLHRNFRCISGTHPDRNPSMSFKKEGNYVKCFSCGFSGDIFSVAGHYWGTDFAQTAQRLEEIYPECTIGDTGGSEGATYLSRRGITKATAQHFGVKEVSHYTAYTQEEKPYDFGPAILIPPEPNEDAAMVRSTKEHRFYKPANEKETLFFRSELDQNDPVFIVESAICAMTVWQCGGHAIALNGTSWRKLEEEIQERYETGRNVPPLILSLDKDQAGEKASGRLLEALQEIGAGPVIDYPVSGSGKDPNELYLSDPESLKKNILLAKQAVLEPVPVKNNLTDYIADTFLADLKRRAEQTGGRKTGFPSLDRNLGGFPPGLYVVGGRPAVGKSTFLDQLAWTLSENEPVLYFSYEQSKLHFAVKQISRLSYILNKPVRSFDLLQGHVNESVIEAMEQYVEDGRKYYFQSTSCDVQGLIDEIKRYEKELGRSPIVVIDYMQRIPTAERGAREALDAVLTALSTFAHEKERTIILVSSFNRAAYYAPIAMDSYRESGNVEFSADVLLGLQYSCVKQPVFMQESKLAEKQAIMRQEETKPSRSLELVCVKNKYGPQFTLPLQYHAEYDYFTEEVRRQRL